MPNTLTVTERAKVRSPIAAPVSGRRWRCLWSRPMGRTAVSIAILGTIVTGCDVVRWWAPTRDDVVERVVSSAVQVLVEQQEGRRLRAGSGVVIATREGAGGTECFVLTSAHTVTGVQGRWSVSVVFDRHRGDGVGKKAPAAVLAERETPEDLAILRAESDGCVPTRQGPPPRLGSPVWVVAFPWGKRMTLASGVVSQLDVEIAGEEETDARLMVDASVSYGASGGGVFDARSGGLIGVVESYRTARVTSQGAGPEWYIDVPVPGQTVVTPLAKIRRFLAETGYSGLVGPLPWWRSMLLYQ